MRSHDDALRRTLHAGYREYFDLRLQRRVRIAFYATDVTVVIEPQSLMCFDALVVASSGCAPEVCGSVYFLCVVLTS